MISDDSDVGGPLLRQRSIIIYLDLLEGACFGDGEQAFAAVARTVLRDDVDLVIGEGEVLADVAELGAIDAVVSVVEDNGLVGADVGQRARLVAEVPLIEEEGARGEAWSYGVGLLDALRPYRKGDLG